MYLLFCAEKACQIKGHTNKLKVLAVSLISHLDHRRKKVFDAYCRLLFFTVKEGHMGTEVKRKKGDNGLLLWGLIINFDWLIYSSPNILISNCNLQKR